MIFMELIGKKLSDGKGIGEKGRLVRVRIDTFQHFYGLALKYTKGMSEAMPKATLGILHHYMEQANTNIVQKAEIAGAVLTERKLLGKILINQ